MRSHKMLGPYLRDSERLMACLFFHQLKKGIMGRPGLDAAKYLVDFTGIPLTPEEAMKKMEGRQEELFQKVRSGSVACPSTLSKIELLTAGPVRQVTPMPGALRSVSLIQITRHNTT